jgi:TRAP-type C4-dicarboxylate transport system permease small subunit
METQVGSVCPNCKISSPLSSNFCPNCGRRLQAIVPSTSVSKQILIYLISFFLAPFGLWYAWKYLKQDNKKSKAIGYVAIALTVISIAITIGTMAALFNSLRQLFNLLTGFDL